MSDDVKEIIGVNLTKKEQAELVFNFEEDNDLWLVFLSQYINTQGQDSEKLKKALLDNSDEWKKIVNRVKQTKFEDLKALVCEKIVQWNFRVRQLLLDEGQINIFKFYLRALVSLKSKKITEVGYRAKTKKQFNSIIAAIASDAYTTLEQYIRISGYLTTGKTSKGEDLTEEGKTFYNQLYNEDLAHVAALVAIILLFKGASCENDIINLQNFIRQNLIHPLEAKVLITKDNDEKDRIRSRLISYRKLVFAVEISFA